MKIILISLFLGGAAFLTGRAWWGWYKRLDDEEKKRVDERINDNINDDFDRMGFI